MYCTVVACVACLVHADHRPLTLASTHRLGRLLSDVVSVEPNKYPEEEAVLVWGGVSNVLRA